MVMYIAAILGLSHYTAYIVALTVLIVGVLVMTYCLIGVYDVYYDEKTRTLVSKFRFSHIIGAWIGIFFILDYFQYEKNSKDCNVMQAQMTVTYAGFNNNPRIFDQNINVCRNINWDGSYADWYVDSIRN